jgi:GDP/UDP-N,N'-diacetylbacillosamine 2-epimerase (hydrolysing)
MKHNVCVISGSRAEYGLLKNLLHHLNNSKEINYQLICTGSHLSGRSGNTIQEINDDGFRINASVKILSNSSSALDTCNATSNCLKKISKELLKLKPKMVILLGDRFEIFASAVAATILNIPIGHIHGGETTQGAIDEAFRHSITKMSYLHFVAADDYKKRVIQLGESKNRVFNVGGMGIDAIRNLKTFSKEYLEGEYTFIKNSKYLMITYHPETLDEDSQLDKLEHLLMSLDAFKDVKFIFTSSNLDTGGDEVNKRINSFVKDNNNAYFYKSLGQKLYFSLMKYSSGVIGNSSSGLLEAPYFNIGTVNIGERQKGRIMSSSVINVKANKSAIKRALKVILSEDNKSSIRSDSKKYPFGLGGASKRIVKILERELSKNNPINLKKKFFDL